ncbi:MAG: hypothetical protein RBT80_26295 [Candidatus Vecturithrix sp.]|jgi:DNA-binding transcriptional regulator YdaS (Cro superfamily)|nr:hypothetical protein [Candidatus Vecturithrix sp.]
MQTQFEKLREYFGNHKAAARGLGVSYTQYNTWRRLPDQMSTRAISHIELAVEAISKRKGTPPGKAVAKK